MLHVSFFKKSGDSERELDAKISGGCLGEIRD